jgi:hypothetical protein
VWGTHRLLTKGRKRELVRHVPILVRVGEPLHPSTTDDPTEVTIELKKRMQVLLDSAVAAYPEKAEPGAWWMPGHLGGGAPTPEEAAELERADVAARRARRAAKAAKAAKASKASAKP